MSTTRVAALAIGALLCAGAARATETLDAYRALDHAGRARVLACARAEIGLPCQPVDTLQQHFADVARADSLAPDWPGAPCGVYLSLAKGRSTRACVGSLTPLGGTLATTLRELARRVVSDDPRHPPVRCEELDSLTVLVSFAGTPEPVADPMAIAPAREGLLIATPQGSIAFLPGEARTIAWALGEARRAGVLQRASDASFQRFAVVVLREPSLPRSR